MCNDLIILIVMIVNNLLLYKDLVLLELMVIGYI